MIKKKICGYFLIAVCTLSIVMFIFLLLVPSAVDSFTVRASYIIYLLVFLLGLLKGIKYVRGYRSFRRPLPFMPEKSIINLGTTEITYKEYIKITAFAPDNISLFVVYFLTTAFVNLALGYRSLGSGVILPLLFASLFVILLRAQTFRGFKMLYPLTMSAEESGMRINGIYKLSWLDIHKISLRGEYVFIERVNIYENPLLVLNRRYIINGEEYSTAELISGCVDRALEEKKRFDELAGRK